jgi:predicted NAD/FAD-binding protein
MYSSARPSSRTKINMRIAVIGSGISGLSTAWLLSSDHDVTLFERNPRLGGHSNTVEIDHNGTRIAVDTGFIVYNEATYPNLISMFAHLGVPTQISEMSFSVSVADGALEYEGSLRGAAVQPINLLKPWYWAMWRDIVKFYNSAPAALDDDAAADLSLGTYLEREGYGAVFRVHHLLPMAAAIWSCPMKTMLEFPVRSFVRFFVNHGLFNLTSRPAWHTVVGGSQVYVDKLAQALKGTIRLSNAVQSVKRQDTGVLVTDKAGERILFDHVVIASHGDEALAVLDDPTDQERNLLSAFTYQTNTAILHRDPSQMPHRQRAWASWNHMARDANDLEQKVSLTYWMNRLQNIDHRYPLFVTMNPFRAPDPELVFETFSYEHPVFDQAAVAAQDGLPTIQGQNRTWFCGSYCGYGFHEDGLKAGIAVARAFGVNIPWTTSVCPASQPPSQTEKQVTASQQSLAPGGG